MYLYLYFFIMYSHCIYSYNVFILCLYLLSVYIHNVFIGARIPLCVVTATWWASGPSAPWWVLVPPGGS